MPNRTKTWFYIANGLWALKANPRILLAHHAVQNENTKIQPPKLIKNTQTDKDKLSFISTIHSTYKGYV